LPPTTLDNKNASGVRCVTLTLRNGKMNAKLLSSNDNFQYLFKMKKCVLPQNIPAPAVSPVLAPTIKCRASV